MRGRERASELTMLSAHSEETATENKSEIGRAVAMAGHSMREAQSTTFEKASVMAR